MTEISTTGNEIDKGGVNHPSHYNMDASGIECIEIVRYLDFNLGSAYKYVFRAGQKYEGDNPTEYLIKDLNKALWYLDDEIANIDYNSGFDPLVCQKMFLVWESREGNTKMFFETMYYIYATRGLQYKMLLERAKEYIQDEILKNSEPPSVKDLTPPVASKSGYIRSTQDGPPTPKELDRAMDVFKHLIDESKKINFCTECSGPYDDWLLQYGGHWDTCRNGRAFETRMIAEGKTFDADTNNWV